jgi:hypothetical protein
MKIAKTKLVSIQILSLLFFAVLTGCAGTYHTDSYLRDDLKAGLVQRVAVLPFENNCDERYAAERARDIVITQALALGVFDVVGKRQVDSILRQEAIDTTATLDTQNLSRLGMRLNVQAFLLGSVNQAGTARLGSVTVPEISLTLSLIEVQTGQILWQGSGSGNGDSFVDRLIGLYPVDAYQVTTQLVSRLLKGFSNARGANFMSVAQNSTTNKQQTNQQTNRVN